VTETGTAAFAIGVFLCGSVGTHEPTDPSLNAATGIEVSNLFGNSGAIVADLALQTFGFAAWMAGLCLMIGGAMRAVFEVAGVQNVLAKSYGSRNPVNLVRATVNALTNMHDPEYIAAKRGKAVEEIRA